MRQFSAAFHTDDDPTDDIAGGCVEYVRHNILLIHLVEWFCWLCILAARFSATAGSDDTNSISDICEALNSSAIVAAAYATSEEEDDEESSDDCVDNCWTQVWFPDEDPSRLTAVLSEHTFMLMMVLNVNVCACVNSAYMLHPLDDDLP